MEEPIEIEVEGVIQETPSSTSSPSSSQSLVPIDHKQQFNSTAQQKVDDSPVANFFSTSMIGSTRWHVLPPELIEIIISYFIGSLREIIVSGQQNTSKIQRKEMEKKKKKKKLNGLNGLNELKFPEIGSINKFWRDISRKYSGFEEGIWIYYCFRNSDSEKKKTTIINRKLLSSKTIIDAQQVRELQSVSLRLLLFRLLRSCPNYQRGVESQEKRGPNEPGKRRGRKFYRCPNPLFFQ